MAEKEIELCFFCEVTDNSGYDKANGMEQHEQWEFRLPPGDQGERRGRVRIRKTTANNQDAYQETIKTPNDPNSTLGDNEETVDITEAYFTTWIKTFGTNGQKKTRYFFLSENVTMTLNGCQIKLPNVKFEVDRFFNAQGQKSQWVKIDVEIQDIIRYLKEADTDITHAKFELDFSNLPLGIKRIVSANTEDADEKAGIANFFDKFKILPGK